MREVPILGGRSLQDHDESSQAGGRGHPAREGEDRTDWLPTGGLVNCLNISGAREARPLPLRRKWHIKGGKQKDPVGWAGIRQPCKFSFQNTQRNKYTCKFACAVVWISVPQGLGVKACALLGGGRGFRRWGPGGVG